MGIKGLDKFIRDNTVYTVKHEKMDILYDKSVIIDISCLLYRYILHNDQKFMNIFKSILKKMENYKIKPIFVFDGKAPEEKQNAILKRKERTQTAINELETLENDKKLVNNLNNADIASYLVNKYLECEYKPNKYVNKHVIENVINTKIDKVQKKTIQLKYNHIDQIKDYLNRKQISYIHSNIEADLICANFVKYGLVDYCISDDTDMFPYNCNYVIRNINFRTETLDIYNKKQLLTELDINNSQFLDLCILLGSDYIPRTIGIKPNNILYLIKKYNSIENIIDNIDLINEDEKINKKIFMNQIDKYNNIRNIFNDTLKLNNIINDVNIYCNNITNKLISVVY